MNRWLSAFLITAALAVSFPAAAQSPIPFSVETRIDMAIPTGELAEIATAAPGWRFSAALQVIPNLGVYGAYSRTHFDLNGADAAGRAVDSGFAVGLTAGVPGIAVLGFSPWVGAGVVFHDLSLEGVPPAQGRTQAGFEFGGGLAIPVLPAVRITPAVAYRQYGAPLPENPEAEISYFSVGAGVNVSF